MYRSFRLYTCALVCIYLCIYVRYLCEGYQGYNASWSHYSFYRDPYRYRLTTVSSYHHRPHRSHSHRCRQSRRRNLVSRPRSIPFNVSLFSADTPASGVFRWNGAFRSADSRRHATNAEHYRLRFKRLDTDTANGCKLHRHGSQRWCSFHRDGNGPIGNTGSGPAMMPAASYSCRRR